MYKLGSDLISCLLQYSNPCAMLNQNKNFCIVTNLESHPKRKNIAVLIRVFLRKKKSADINYLFTKSQLLISPPLYYTTLDILFSSNHNIHKSSYVLLFLGFRSFSWWILLKSFNKRVPSPKTKAIKSFMNVVIWRKKYI